MRQIYVRFQFSIWDAPAGPNACPLNRGGSFQFSIWDAQVAVRQPGSSGEKRVAFNSLFEMRTHTRRPLGAGPGGLSILYLRCRSSTGLGLSWKTCSSPFNSLFEMPTISARTPGTVGISYAFNSLFEMRPTCCAYHQAVSTSFQFSIWDAGQHACNAHWNAKRHFQFSIWDALQLHQGHDYDVDSLSILYLRCAPWWPQCLWPTPWQSFNSLFEMLIKNLYYW